MELTQWFLSDQADHWLHLLTFISLFLVGIGFFYVSYEVLSKPQGVLREILIIITHVGLSIATSLVLLYPLVKFFTSINVYPEICTININGVNNRAGVFELILDVFVFTMMLGSLQGVLTARFFSSRDFMKIIKARDETKNERKIFILTDFFIGLVFALVFYFIDDYIVFPTCSLHDAYLSIPDLLQIIVLGALGSGFWRRYSHPNKSPRLSDEDWKSYHAYEVLFGYANPSARFSFTDFLQGLLYWLFFGLLSIIVWAIAAYGVKSNPDWISYQLDAIFGIASISVTCGISRHMTWELLFMPEKRLGIIGAIITIIGFVLGFIEPLLLFARPYLQP